METEIQKRHNDCRLSEIPIQQGETGIFEKAVMSLLKNKNRAGIKSDICSLLYIPTRINSYGWNYLSDDCYGRYGKISYTPLEKHGKICYTVLAAGIRFFRSCRVLVSPETEHWQSSYLCQCPAVFCSLRELRTTELNLTSISGRMTSFFDAD